MAHTHSSLANTCLSLALKSTFLTRKRTLAMQDRASSHEHNEDRVHCTFLIAAFKVLAQFYCWTIAARGSTCQSRTLRRCPAASASVLTQRAAAEKLELQSCAKSAEAVVKFKTWLEQMRFLQRRFPLCDIHLLSRSYFSCTLLQKQEAKTMFPILRR